MVKVQYTGNADVRELGAADLKKAGVEGFRATQFKRGEVVEVDEGIGTALLESPLFQGEFTRVDNSSDDDNQGDFSAENV